MTFAWPWALLGLLALPALAAIYWLRQRARRRPVSSLLLWRDAPESRTGGRTFERFEAPPVFLLELLILLLLVGAAAGPRIPTRESRRPLVVVLDDSFSMLAGGESSPRAAAVADLLRELEKPRHSRVTLIAAGEHPQVLSETGLSETSLAGTADAAGDVAARLGDWRAMAPSSRLEEAISLAFDLGGERARVLVLSDRAPPEPPTQGRLSWWAFGRARPNLALVGAVRAPDGQGGASDGCLVEIANYSARAEIARLKVAPGEAPAGEATRVELGPGEVGRFRFQAPAGEVVRVSLDGGSALDDRAILLPERRRFVRVELSFADQKLRRLIGEAVDATGLALRSPRDAQLVITDDADAPAPAGGWRLVVAAGDGAVPYVGPFVLDRGHPLTSGLALDGVIWGAAAGAGGGEGGAAVVTAGDVILLDDRETADGRHRLTLRWLPELSTLQRTPNWPILWWNLLEWRARSIPGVRAANLRLGGLADVGLRPGAESVELLLPDGSARSLSGHGGRLEIRADQVGIHQLRHAGRTDRWAVNALAPAESDLRRAQSGRWGDWESAASARWERRSIAWALLLLAAAALVAHLAWTSFRGSGR